LVGATTFEEQEKLPAKSSVAANATVAAFSERLLRDMGSDARIFENRQVNGSVKGSC
jgi:hypothetical protein